LVEGGDAGPWVGGVVAAAWASAGGSPAEGLHDLAELILGDRGVQDGHGFGEGDLDIHRLIMDWADFSVTPSSSPRQTNTHHGGLCQRALMTVTLATMMANSQSGNLNSNRAILVSMVFM
jgi:hypothetical protein